MRLPRGGAFWPPRIGRVIRRSWLGGLGVVGWLTAVSASTCVNNHHPSLGSHLGRGAIKRCIFSVILLGFRTFYSFDAVSKKSERNSLISVHSNPAP